MRKDNNSQNLLFRLILLTKRWRQVVDQQLMSSGLTDATWRPLFHIYLLGNDVRQKDLAESIGIAGPSLVRLLDTLLAKKLINRREDNQDRRVKRLSLTTSGEQIALKLQQAINTIDQQLLCGLSARDLEQLIHSTTLLETNLDTIINQDKPK